MQSNRFPFVRSSRMLLSSLSNPFISSFRFNCLHGIAEIFSILENIHSAYFRRNLPKPFFRILAIYRVVALCSGLHDTQFRESGRIRTICCLIHVIFTGIVYITATEPICVCVCVRSFIINSKAFLSMEHGKRIFSVVYIFRWLWLSHRRYMKH